MSQLISEFHYSLIFIDGRKLASVDALHQELALKLGLPWWSGRNWNAILAALSSIGQPGSNLCAHWDFRAGKRMVLQIRPFFTPHADITVLNSLLHIVAEANGRLCESGQNICIWVEFVSETTTSPLQDHPGHSGSVAVDESPTCRPMRAAE